MEYFYVYIHCTFLLPFYRPITSSLSPAPCYSSQNSRRQRNPSIFIGLEDGDRLTVFFNRTVVFRGLDGFSGFSDYKRAFHGLGLASGEMVFHRFLNRKKLTDIGF